MFYLESCQHCQVVKDSDQSNKSSMSSGLFALRRATPARKKSWFTGPVTGLATSYLDPIINISMKCEMSDDDAEMRVVVV
jgi:hypothetical protein